MSFLHMVLARIRAFLRPDPPDRDFEQELEAHLAMAEKEKILRGMTPQEARRQARLELGGVTQLREAGRAARGLPWLDTSLLDLKLGLRMLRKSWGITLVGGLAMTITIGLGAAVFAAIDTVARSSLPFQGGERIVAIQPWDPDLGKDQNASLQDFQRWSRELKLVEEIGAYRSIRRRDSLGSRTFIAEITASALGLPRVQPLLGRVFSREDEQVAAEPVVIIGYDTWQSRFSRDPQVLGRRILLDNTLYSVIGVMPKGFAFPVNFGFWTPLRRDLAAGREDEDSSVFVIARLASGVTIESARAEVAALGLLPADPPERDWAPRTRVVPYASTFNDDIRNNRWLIRIILILVALLLVPPCANIAILLFARNLTRQEEFAARYVLGASRGRIVLQLLIEALVLAALAGGAGLLLARQLLWQLQGLVNQELAAIPYWMDFSLSLKTLGFVAALSLFASLLAGGIPAWRATGRLRQSCHHALGSRSGGLRLGRTWRALVVAQVTLSMAAVPTAVEITWKIFRPTLLGPGFAAEEFLTARVGLDSAPSSNTSSHNDRAFLNSRFADLEKELIRRLREDPAVAGVTASARVPGEESLAYFEVEALAGPRREPVLAASNRVDKAFFEVFDVPRLTGRAFQTEDFTADSKAVIVNRFFAEQLAGDGNVVGRRLRYVKQSGETALEGPWYEIAGVVEDLPRHRERRRVYHPLAPGQGFPVSLSLHVGSTIPPALTARLNELPSRLDPDLRIDQLRSLEEIYREQEVNNHLAGYALAAVMICVLLFSLAGIYTLISFTVAHRRREIGIRSALGAQPWRLVTHIVSRALLPVSLGALVGGLLALLTKFYLTANLMGAQNGMPGLIPVIEMLLILVGLLAALGPARRALRVDPTDVLREG